VNLALTVLNVTPVAPLKFVPLIVTLIPTVTLVLAGPLVGVKLVIVGATPPVTVSVPFTNVNV
jgi:hypothetical protein